MLEALLPISVFPLPYQSADELQASDYVGALLTLMAQSANLKLRFILSAVGVQCGQSRNKHQDQGGRSNSRILTPHMCRPKPLGSDLSSSNIALPRSLVDIAYQHRGFGFSFGFGNKTVI
jgi:hypothetical protein